MEDIATEAGISRPILYRHFGDATGIHAAVGTPAELADEVTTVLWAGFRGAVAKLPAAQAGDA